MKNHLTTIAIIILAAWCAYLTYKVNKPLDPDAVWNAYETAKQLP